MVILLAAAPVTIGCPSPGFVMGALQLSGMVAWIAIAGVLLVTFWEVYQARLQARLRDEGG